MPYPVVSELAGKAWYQAWQEACQQAGTRVAPPAPPESDMRDIGDEVDWVGVASDLVRQLLAMRQKHTEGYLESEGSILVHQALPDHEALRDPEFWYWLATGHGLELIEARYPFKQPVADGSASPMASPKFLPGRNNFVGSSAKETLYFRFWIRAEMAVLLKDDTDGRFEYVRPGLIDFWRSHVFRQLYAHHRPFVQAFVDFQFPAPNRTQPKLKTLAIRQLASDLSKSCANVTVELLDRANCKALIEKQWKKTEAKMQSVEESQEDMAAE